MKQVAIGVEAGAIITTAAIAGTAAVVSQAASDIARGEVSDFGACGWAALRESTIERRRVSSSD